MSAPAGRAGVVAALIAALCLACPRADGPIEQPEEPPPPEAPGWVQPILDFEEPPPTGHAGMFAIARDRVGPLYADMPVELRFLQQLFTDFEVRGVVEEIERDREQRVFEIYDHETRLLVVEPDELARPEEVGEIDRVRVESPLFRAPSGLGVGDFFEVIARAHGPLECRADEHPETEEPVAICRSPADGGVLRWLFPAPEEPMPPGWLTPAASEEYLSGAIVSEVWWEPADD